MISTFDSDGPPYDPVHILKTISHSVVREFLQIFITSSRSPKDFLGGSFF